MTRSIARIDAADAPRVPRRRRRPAGADDHPGLRGVLAAPRGRGLRPARRKGHLVRSLSQRGGQRARSRHPHRRRRQLGWAGGAVLLDSREQRHHHLPRRGAREEHVALSRRPDRWLGRTCARCPGRRSWPPTARSPSRRSTCARTRPARPSGWSRAGSSSSSARTRRPAGSRPRSPWTSAATCSPGPRSAPPTTGRSTRDPYLLETSVPGVFACGDVRFEPGQAGGLGRGRGQHGHRLRPPVPQSGGERSGGRLFWRIAPTARSFGR